MKQDAMNMRKHIPFVDVEGYLHDYPDGPYYMIIGKRSNGKTFGALKYAIKRYLEYGEQFVYLRRWREDIIASRMNKLFAYMNTPEAADELYPGYRVHYYNGQFYLIDAERPKTNPIHSYPIIGYALCLSAMEHDKSLAYPLVTTVIFDEFLSRNTPLFNEFVIFSNTISTIARNRDDVKVIMLSNPVAMDSPYFSEMGLRGAANQEQGTIDVYSYGHTDLKVNVFRTPDSESEQFKSNRYFAFDNPELEMITHGKWELPNYPHINERTRPSDTVYSFFVADWDPSLSTRNVNDKAAKGSIIILHDTSCLLFSKHTKEIQPSNLCFVKSPTPNIIRPYGFSAAPIKLAKYIKMCFATNRVFYGDNEVGEYIHYYMQLTGGF